MMRTPPDDEFARQQQETRRIERSKELMKKTLGRAMVQRVPVPKEGLLVFQPASTEPDFFTVASPEEVAAILDPTSTAGNIIRPFATYLHLAELCLN